MAIDEKISVLLAFRKLIDLADGEIDFYTTMHDQMQAKVSQYGEVLPHEQKQLDGYKEKIKAMQVVKEEIEKLALSK